MSNASSNKPDKTDATGKAVTGHEYDGIVEYDNPLPRWWKNLFWGTVVFSLVYYVHYQLTGNGASVADAYAEDMRLFREQIAAQALGESVTEEGLLKLMADPQLVRDGHTVYVTRCQQCHAEQAQGNIGPNLTDDHWIHGNGSLMTVYETVSNGVTQKGMPAWARTLRPMELGQVVAFVGSIRGTHVPGKAPEGQKIDLATAAATSADSAPAAASAEPAPAGAPPAPGPVTPARLELPRQP